MSMSACFCSDKLAFQLSDKSQCNENLSFAPGLLFVFLRWLKQTMSWINLSISWTQITVKIFCSNISNESVWITTETKLIQQRKKKLIENIVSLEFMNSSLNSSERQNKGQRVGQQKQDNTLNKSCTGENKQCNILAATRFSKNKVYSLKAREIVKMNILDRTMTSNWWHADCRETIRYADWRSLLPTCEGQTFASKRILLLLGIDARTR